MVKIDMKKCLRCGVCIEGCPEGAFVVVNKETEEDGLNLYTIKVDPEKCNDCGICLAYEWYCPAQAISKA